MNKLNKRILIVAEDLQKVLDDPRTVVVDCRFDLADPLAGQRLYSQAHVPGAVFLDLDKDLAGPVTRDTGRHPLPDPGDLSAKLGGLGISRAHDIVVYDASHGGLAARAWWIFRWLGHDNVRLLDGGFSSWRSLDLPVESGSAVRTPAEYRPDLRDELVLTTAELLASADNFDALRLVDARDAARFRGEQEPIDPVAGHIPGARNLPFSEFVREDGTWRALERRAGRLSQLLGGQGDIDWSVMCGSGVTACHLAISALEAGIREPRVYIGSWSEWIRDPDRPIALGAG